MKKDYSLNEIHFENLLNWLSNDRELAGEKYELLRTGLIRFFRFRGCQDPSFLADETMNRVAAGVPTFDSAASSKPLNVCFGFASKIFLEYHSRYKKKEVQLEPTLLSKQPSLIVSDEPENVAHDCLEICLKKLGSDEQYLVIQYYSKTGAESFALRRKLAETLNLKIGTLHTRVFRVRSVLKDCVESCTAGK